MIECAAGVPAFEQDVDLSPSIPQPLSPSILRKTVLPTTPLPLSVLEATTLFPRREMVSQSWALLHPSRAALLSRIDG